MEFHQPRAIDGIERKTEDKEAVRGNIYEMIQQLRTGSSTDLTDGHGRWVPGQDARRWTTKTTGSFSKEAQQIYSLRNAGKPVSLRSFQTVTAGLQKWRWSDSLCWIIRNHRIQTRANGLNKKETTTKRTPQRVNDCSATLLDGSQCFADDLRENTFGFDGERLGSHVINECLENSTRTNESTAALLWWSGDYFLGTSLLTKIKGSKKKALFCSQMILNSVQGHHTRFVDDAASLRWWCKWKQKFECARSADAAQTHPIPNCGRGEIPILFNWISYPTSRPSPLHRSTSKARCSQRVQYTSTLARMRSVSIQGVIGLANDDDYSISVSGEDDSKMSPSTLDPKSHCPLESCRVFGRWPVEVPLVRLQSRIFWRIFRASFGLGKQKFRYRNRKYCPIKNRRPDGQIECRNQSETAEDHSDSREVSVTTFTSRFNETGSFSLFHQFWERTGFMKPLSLLPSLLVEGQVSRLLVEHSNLPLTERLVISVPAHRRVVGSFRFPAVPSLRFNERYPRALLESSISSSWSVVFFSGPTADLLAEAS